MELTQEELLDQVKEEFSSAPEMYQPELFILATDMIMSAKLTPLPQDKFRELTPLDIGKWMMRTLDAYKLALNFEHAYEMGVYMDPTSDDERDQYLRGEIKQLSEEFCQELHADMMEDGNSPFVMFVLDLLSQWIRNRKPVA